MSDKVRDLHRNLADLFDGTGEVRLLRAPLDSPDLDASLASSEERNALIEEHRKAALCDDFGHGTHVAGIIGGEYPLPARAAIRLLERQFKVDGDGKKVTSSFVERYYRAKTLSSEKAEPRGRHEPRGMAQMVVLAKAQVLIPALESDQETRKRFVLLLRSILNPEESHPDDGSDDFFTRPSEEVFAALPEQVLIPGGSRTSGAATVGQGGAAGLSDFMGGVGAAARRLANYTSYYEMKTRAGAVGRVGLAPVLRTSATTNESDW